MDGKKQRPESGLALVARKPRLPTNVDNYVHSFANANEKLVF